MGLYGAHYRARRGLPLGLLADFQAEVKALQAAPTPEPKVVFGEVALAEPMRALFPEGFYVKYNPSDLVTRRGMAIFDRMRNDDQVKAALSFKKDAALATGWRIDSPKDETEEWEPARFVHNQFDALEGTFEETLRGILTSLDYGVSITEKVYEPVVGGEWDGLLGLKALKTRRPHEFQFIVDQHGNLHPDGLLQGGNPFKLPEVGQPGRLPVAKFVIFVNEFEFSNWYGHADLEAAFRGWWAKENGYKFLVILLERLGVPPVIALYDPARYPSPLDEQLKSALKNLQANTTGMIPRMGGGGPGAGLEFWVPEKATQATSVFIPSLDKFDKDIARALLMPQHLGVTTESQVGSFAKAKKIFELFMLAVERLRGGLQERAVNEQIVRPLVDLNFGPLEQYPRFALQPITEEQKLDLFDRWIGAVNANVVTPQPEDEDHIREMLEMPEKVAHPELDRRLFPAPMLPFGQKGGKHKHYALRQPNRLERLTNFAGIERSLDTFEGEALDGLRAALIESRDVMLAFVERRLTDAKPSMVDDVKLRNVADLTRTLRSSLEQAFRSGARELRGEVPRFFQTGPTFTPTEALRWLEQRADLIGTQVSGRLLERVRSVLLNAIKIGEPQRETLDKLRKSFEDYLGEPGVTREGEEISPHRLETILRTNLTEAFNQGRLVTARAEDVAPFLRGMAYSAIIDDRTTEVCRFLDGKVFRMGEPEMDRLAPPNHFNCRSILVPVTMDMTLDEREFITPSELGRAEELAQEGFK